MGKTLEGNRRISIYVIRDATTLEVRYIGKTVAKLSARLTQHISDAKRNRNHRCNWFKSLTIRPIIEEIDSCNWDKSQELESYYIRYYWEIGTRLINSSTGGEGGLGVVRTQETKDRMSATLRKKSKPVYQYSLLGKLIYKYSSAKEASETLGLIYTNIVQCCNLGKKSHGNYVWSYLAPDLFNIELYNPKKLVFKMYEKHISKTKATKVKAENVTTGDILLFNSLKEAAVYTNKSIPGICCECKGTRKVRGNYKFEYYNG